MKKTFFISLFGLSLAHTQAQDTLKIMSHNILNYSTSHYPTRYNDFKEILMYVQPDIVICQEVVESAAAQALLDNAFAPAGIGTFSRATFIDGPDTDNTLFYNSSKIKFKSQNQIVTGVRNITRYRLYYLISPTDTAWINLFSLHLKASTGFESDRLAECKDLCTYMGTLGSAENIIVGGDFNFYSNITETGFNWLTSSNCGQQLYDPINRIGDWNNNSAFKDVHTQSTRTATEPDGGSTGGLDDRFDWLFINDNVRDGLSKVRYVPGSYTVIGNDANHFNSAVNAAPTNTAVSATVANALYNMSDHLPISLKIALGTTVGISEYANQGSGNTIVWINDGTQTQTHFSITAKEYNKANLVAYDMLGNVVCTKTVELLQGQNDIALPITNQNKGQYLLKLETKNGWTGCKFIVF